MKSITIQGTKRESVGKKANKALRNADLVPCVVYGGKDAVHFSTHNMSFKNIIYTANATLVEIDLGDSKINAVVQDVQYHPVSDKILHVDFYQLFADKEIALDIPVVLEGNSKGVVKGGALRFNMRKLKVKALPANLPDFLTLNITDLEIGDKAYVSALKGDNYTLLSAESAVVVAVRMSRTAMKNQEVEETEEA